MKFIYKALKQCYTDMSILFKKILYLGSAIFLVMQLLCAALNIWYICEGYMHMDIKNLADLCFSTSYTLITITGLVCIFGDYVRGGLGPKN